MSTDSIHTVLISLHAASGVISFLAGCLLIFSPRHLSNRRLFGWYIWFLVGSVVLLLSAMLVYWTEYSSSERIVFAGLFVLGLYMLYRARSAHHLLITQPEGWKRSTIEHIGFTLISLFEGFVIVTVLNTGGPGWLVALFVLLGILIGRWVIGLAQRRSNIYGR